MEELLAEQVVKSHTQNKYFNYMRRVNKKHVIEEDNYDLDDVILLIT